MRIENPAALRFIIDDDIYLLDKDKPTMAIPAQPATAIPSLATTLPPPVETPVTNFKYMGGNKKNFLIIVHYTDNEFIDITHLTALENILKRKELHIDDVAILNIHNHDSVSISEIATHFTPQKLLLMGKNAMPQNMQVMTLNQITNQDNYLVLYSFSFDEMMSSNENKKAFWDQMKAL